MIRVPYPWKASRVRDAVAPWVHLIGAEALASPRVPGEGGRLVECNGVAREGDQVSPGQG